MLFYLAALQSIPTDVYEAAAIDGAGAWRTFWKITFPLLRPAHFFVLVVFGIGALKLFDQAFLVSGGQGGPNYSTLHAPCSTSTARRSTASSSGSRPRPASCSSSIIFGLTVCPAADDRAARRSADDASQTAEHCRGRSSRRRSALGAGSRASVVVYVLLVRCIALLFFVPFIWTLSPRSRRIPDSVTSTLIPNPWTTAAWHTVWSRVRLRALHPQQLLPRGRRHRARTCSSPALGGYAFARLRFPGRELLFLLVLGTLMIPDQLRLIPVFVMLTNWHLIGNFSGYILINLVTATNLFFMRQYFLTIPKDFEEAAKLDGAGYFKTFWRVMLPLAAAGDRGASRSSQFQGTWNDFFWPLILFGQGSPHYTVQLGLAQLRSPTRRSGRS